MQAWPTACSDALTQAGNSVNELVVERISGLENRLPQNLSHMDTLSNFVEEPLMSCQHLVDTPSNLNTSK